MVSHSTQPPPAYSSFAPPSHRPPAPPVGRAPSVSSGRSYTGRHRHARSHHGASSACLPHNEFPVFSLTGDVEILVSNLHGTKENRYVLHRLILSQCSGFFEAGTRADWSGSQRPARGGLETVDENSASTLTSSSCASSTGQGKSADVSTSSNGKQTWRYAVNWAGVADGEAPMLVKSNGESTSIFGSSQHDRPPAVRNKPPASNETFFRSMTNFSALSLSERPTASERLEPGDEILKDYDNLFRTMYQYPPVLDTTNIANAYAECKALLNIADMYDALEIVGSRVDHHLLRFGARLFKQIAKYPPSYLKLGYLARSPTIFTEAMIHVVGQWPLGAGQLRNQIDAGVLDLIEDKVDEMREQEERVEFKLWRLTLTTSRGERVTPANDYLAFLALSLFRQWLAENTTPAPTGILKDTSRPSTNGSAPPPPSSQHGRSSSSNRHTAQRGAPLPQLQQQATAPAQSAHASTGRIYRLLGSTSNTAYLNHDELKRFLKLLPDQYTRDNLRRFERRMDEVKNLARDAVAPLMRNFLELDVSAFGPAGLGYLTCTKLTDRELPWD